MINGIAPGSIKDTLGYSKIIDPENKESELINIIPLLRAGE